VLRTDELEYHLPRELIAAQPVEPRDAARLLVVSRSGDRVEHHRVRDVPSLLEHGDAMVFNRTAVIPARLIGRHEDSGGAVDGLFLEEVSTGEWRVMLSSNRQLRAGMRLILLDAAGAAPAARFELLEGVRGSWRVRLDTPEASAAVLERAGRTPLPPYILKARGGAPFDDVRDRAWYQTVYASRREARSIAAPTAGLHFTSELLAELEQRGVERFDVVLHVGPGTFTPIRSEYVEDHDIHAEEFEVPPKTLALLRSRADPPPGRARRRIIAVGTTTVRTLESIESGPGVTGIAAVRGSTSLMISPPYTFRHVDGLLTNFHLPRSTLLALVAALLGLDRMKRVYALAVESGYRFYSYGDAMLILP
jgi:S-adenosylmethionine:tRNA ribosyltransferase-isomerase